MAILALLVLTVFLLCLVYVYAAMALSSFYGIPFVPTSNSKLSKIWGSIPISTSDAVLDLGCGNGSVLFYVNKHYKVHCSGVEINPLLHFWNTVRSRRIVFKRESMYITQINNVTIIYCFLFPEALEKLKGKFNTEARPGTLLISHGFRVRGWEGREWLIRYEKPFKTYYYQLPVVSL